MHQRLERLRALMAERGCEALLVSSAVNRRYLSGFSGSTGMLLITGGVALIFTDFRYRLRVAQEAPAFELREISMAEPLPRRLAGAAVELELERIGFESEDLTVAQYNQLANAFDEQFREAPAGLGPKRAPVLEPLNGLVETLREIKDTDELALLRHAIALTDAAFAAVLPQLMPEHTERQAAWMFEAAMRERGADGVAFPVIVAAGRNAAQPHAQPGDEPLGAGRPVVIDMGAQYAGYHADLTRTVTLGEPDARFREIYALVLEAQQRAIAGLRAGVTGAAADALARDFLTTAGYGDAFGHGLGHGVGLQIHEGPRLRDNPDGLRAGSVFSVEPGVYLEGWGGVRIEDLVLLHEDGCEVLSQARK